MGNRLAGKTALVTAAADGIGRASALAMAREGARVVATDINTARLAALTGVETRHLDVCDATAIAELAAAMPAPDILFNCAGYVHHGSILACDDAAFERSCDINVKAAYRLIRAFLPGMVARGGGSIINMASVASSVIGAPDRFVYGTTKAAVIGMTKSISADFAGAGIRANAICPGTVDTPSLNDRMAAREDPGAARQAFIARQPMGRLGTAEEIADLVVYLASDESRFMSGAALVIDGGWSNV
jgi:2-keto-3-deoxy-L-fuconate dehydrogenase